MNNQNRQTVGNAIRTVLPKGTFPGEIRQEKKSGSDSDNGTALWQGAPSVPTDLFAVTGYLCKQGGIVGFFDPDPFAKAVDGQFVLDRVQRDLIDDLAWAWRGGKRGGYFRHPKKDLACDPSPGPPPAVQKFWDTLLAAWDSPTNCGAYSPE